MITCGQEEDDPLVVLVQTISNWVQEPRAPVARDANVLLSDLLLGMGASLGSAIDTGQADKGPVL